MKTLKFVGIGILILVGIPLVNSYVFSPYTSKWMNGWESSSSSYAIAAREYSELSEAGRADVRKLMGKGYLTRSDMSDVIKIALKEKEPGQGIQTYPAPDYGDEPEGFNSELWRNIVGKPTVSKAKDALFDMASTDTTVGAKNEHQ